MKIKLCCILVTLLLFSFSYAQADNKNSPAGTLKVEVLELLGHEEEWGVCGTLHADIFNGHSCLMFRRKDGSDVFMWREDALPSNPTKRADLLVAYNTSEKGNIYLTSIANPRPAPVYKDNAVFLGEDAEASDGGVFIFKDSIGDQLYLSCQSSFCSELLKNKGKKMTLAYQRQYYFHEGRKAFEEGDFVLHYNLLN